jgi:hypothetical protein
VSAARVPTGRARLAEKLAAFRAGLTPAEGVRFTGSVGARLEPDAIWPPGAALAQDPPPPPVTISTVPGCGASDALRLRDLLRPAGVPAGTGDR